MPTIQRFVLVMVGGVGWIRASTRFDKKRLPAMLSSTVVKGMLGCTYTRIVCSVKLSSRQGDISLN